MPHNVILLTSSTYSSHTTGGLAMANATRTQLEQAYNLIQQEKLDQAIAIIKPITKAEPNNADAWWLMANAVSEPPDAYEALNNVLRIKPNHAEAKELLGT